MARSNTAVAEAVPSGRVGVPFVEGDAPWFSAPFVMTPQAASELAGRKRDGARENQAAIRAYAQAMKEGRWVLNGMPIIVSRTGRLLDGLQRLRACALAGVPFVTIEAGNVPDDVLHTIDQQRRRSFAGVLDSRGVSNSMALQGALIKLIRYDEGSLGKGGATASWSKMDRVLRANPDLEAVVAYSLKHHAKALMEPVRTPLLFMGARTDPEAVERFLYALQYKDAEPPEGVAAPGDRREVDPLEPGARIRDLIDANRGESVARYHPHALLAMCVKALNVQREGGRFPGRLDFYKWPSASSADGEEAFPVFDGYAGLRDPGPADRSAETARRLRRAAARPVAVEGIEAPVVEDIDAAKAEEYLARNTRNRRIVEAHVEGIARDILAGKWMMNAQPICFSHTGRLLNGQHRLSAVILASRRSEQAGRGPVSVEIPVMRGLPEEAFATYDIHAKKGPAAGGFESFGDAALLAAMAVLLWKRELRPDGVRNAKPTRSEVHDIVERHPRLKELRTFARKMHEFGRPSVMGYAAYVIERDSRRLAGPFLERLPTGADLPAGHVILQLRRRLQHLRRIKSSQQAQFDAVLDAWESYKAKPDLGGKPPKRAAKAAAR